MLTRREFLNATAKHAGLISLAPFAPSFVARTAQAAAVDPNATVLVLLFLDGGNDGINTVVPFKDEGYEKYPPGTSIAAESTDPARRRTSAAPGDAKYGKVVGD